MKKLLLSALLLLPSTAFAWEEVNSVATLSDFIASENCSYRISHLSGSSSHLVFDELYATEVEVLHQYTGEGSVVYWTLRGPVSAKNVSTLFPDGYPLMLLVSRTLAGFEFILSKDQVTSQITFQLCADFFGNRGNYFQRLTSECQTVPGVMTGAYLLEQLC